MDSPKIFDIVFIVSCCILFVESSSLKTSNCVVNNTEQPNHKVRKWLLKGQHEADNRNPHQCNWNFSLDKDRILIINSKSIHIEFPHNEQDECLMIQEHKSKENDINNIPVQPVNHNQFWCFKGNVNITFNNAVCPPPDIHHSLHMEVLDTVENELICEDGQGWIYQCRGDNLAKKSEVKNACSLETPSPSEGHSQKQTDEHIPVPGVKGLRENETATDGPGNTILYVTVLFAFSIMTVLIVGAVIYIRFKQRRDIQKAVRNYRVPPHNAVPRLIIPGHEYESVTSYLAPVSVRRAESDPRNTPISTRSLAPSTDGTTGSFSSVCSSGLPDTYLEDMVMIPSDRYGNIFGTSNTTAVKSIIADDRNQQPPSVETASSTRVFW